MHTTFHEPQEPAERVSSETIQRLNFLLGSALEELRNATIVLVFGKERFELRIDEHGKAYVQALNDQPGS